MMNDTKIHYEYEQGPIRPPSEARSLLVRVTRNCPWNRCAFCPVYKGTQFSVRPIADVKRDIDAVHRHVEALRQLAGEDRRVSWREMNRLAEALEPGEQQAFAAAFHWLRTGLRSVFLQDADSLIMKPPGLIEILTHLRARFPAVERVTCYSRSRTIASRKLDDLHGIRAAGLDRVHVGLESGSDEVLKMVSKGCTRQTHIDAGRKAKNAGFELSEYYMPGLGGRKLSQTHALESADALNQINPDFIRLRTLAIPEGVPLYEAQHEGRFEKCTDTLVAGELLTFIENLHGITSIVKSDHVLNLFPELEGRLPEDKALMTEILRTFLDLEPERQALYQVGRRFGIFHHIHDATDDNKVIQAQELCSGMKITAANVDRIMDELAKGYV